MGMSGMYGPADERESIATIHAALDAGITLLDRATSIGLATTKYRSAERCGTAATVRSSR
jgi:aryl-alcohol dehydrogenase-like predicted oxidoreductase